jgi:transposase
VYLRRNKNKNTGRTHLSIAHGYRDENGAPRHKTIMKIGYLDEMQKQYDDPIAHFEAVAEQMNREREASNIVTAELDMGERLEKGIALRKNYGHIVFSKIYHELEIDRFLKNARRHEKFEFNTDSIMRLLVFTRLLYPCSKRAAVLKKEIFFDNFKFTLDDVYHALTHFDKICTDLQRHLHNQVTEQYNRETDIVYYDVTNYYFEIDKQDELRRRGAEKNNRKDPIVQMGLLMDKKSLPISYKMFPGNTHDSQTLMPVLTEVKKTFGIGRIIVVADKALNSGDNIAYNTILGDGYIYSKSVRGASEDFQKWVVDESGYKSIDENFKCKSQTIPDVPVKVTLEKIGKKKKTKTVKIEQKQIVYYSKKYADRAKHKREEAIAKAMKMIENPSKYKRTYDYGAAGYIINLKTDSDTGEIVNLEETLLLDTEKIEAEAKFDGYTALVTSELDDADEHIIAMYSGLWEIEESFKITKSVLGTRPLHLQTKEHINAHFLTCFISLLIARIVEMRLGGKHTIEQITETLRNVACSHLNQNIWLFDYIDDITDYMNEVFGTNFGKKLMTLQEIKSNLGAVKK